MRSIDTDFQDIHEFLYGELHRLEDAVVEVNRIEGQKNQYGEFSRVAVTDGERYAFSGPIDPESDESIKEGLQEADRLLSNGKGFQLGAGYHTTGQYLEDRV